MIKKYSEALIFFHHPSEDPVQLAICKENLEQAFPNQVPIRDYSIGGIPEIPEGIAKLFDHILKTNPTLKQKRDQNIYANLFKLFKNYAAEISVHSEIIRVSEIQLAAAGIPLLDQARVDCLEKLRIIKQIIKSVLSPVPDALHKHWLEYKQAVDLFFEISMQATELLASVLEAIMKMMRTADGAVSEDFLKALTDDAQRVLQASHDDSELKKECRAIIAILNQLKDQLYSHPSGN